MVIVSLVLRLFYFSLCLIPPIQPWKKRYLRSLRNITTIVTTIITTIAILVIVLFFETLTV